MPLIFVVAGSVASTLASLGMVFVAYRKGYNEGREDGEASLSELQTVLLTSILDAAAAKREES